MKKILSIFLSLLFVSATAIAANNTNSSTPQDSTAAAKPAKKRGPVFRANKDQIKQAQALLKARGF
jgi:hypothetical protein